MKITVKNLTQKKFQLDMADDATIANLKQQLTDQHEFAEPSLQKCIFRGKILTDEIVIASLEVKEKDFFVIMTGKKKPAAQPEPTQPTPVAVQSTPTPETAPTQQPQSQSSEPAPSATPAAQTQQSSANTQPTTPASDATAPTTTTQAQPAASQPQSTLISNDAALVTGDMYEQTVMQLMEMGFERDQVKKALQAAFNNPDRAVEYLFNGIPANAQLAQGPGPQQGPVPTQQPSSALPPAAAQPMQSAANPAPASGALPNPFAPQPATAPQSTGGNLDFLRNHQQFNQLREVVQRNPQLLQPLLQQIGANQPQLLQLINENQEEFIQILNEPIPEGSGSGGGGEGMPQMPPGMMPQSIQVTQEEKDAIERLQSLGFDRNKVIQAYFACDKDETLAANYLFDHANDDDF
eukprot:NODE_636_length_1307_cov_88.719492_g597_i0.p1 GENE.NODE_636_length_1307_cov_88.719492_g597_i0~~NODE_636_length_1307_cov_88.719492_g597_i0.p1  ORF type:complete len:419 (-),score=91.93 NODE_636_length_1307_cov_88.719492_g597_i0:49-1272(-)